MARRPRIARPRIDPRPRMIAAHPQIDPRPRTVAVVVPCVLNLYLLFLLLFLFVSINCSSLL